MRLLSAFSLALFAALALQAQDGPPQGQGGFGRGPGRGGRGMSVAFSLLDGNNDGMLDAKEIDGAPAALAKLDKNGDGQITSDEARPAMPEGRGRGGRGEGGGQTDMAAEMVKTLMAFDANGDGKLSKSELPERFQGLFDRADANHDGFLTPEEIHTMAAAQAAPTGGPEGRGEREGGRGEMNFIRMDPILAAVDANGDGVISAEELRGSAAAIRKLDKNGDGQISRDEAMPMMGRRGN